MQICFRNSNATPITKVITEWLIEAQEHHFRIPRNPSNTIGPRLDWKARLHNEERGITMLSLLPADGILQHADYSHLHRGFKSRHMVMIAIVGAIGTSLVIGIRKALTTSGHGLILIPYTLVGLLVFVVIYTHLLKYIIVAPNKLTASTIFIEEWKTADEVNLGVWIAIFMLTIFCTKYFAVCIIKVMGIVGIIPLSLILMLGGRPRAFKEYIDIGATDQFYGFWSSFINAIFTYLGTVLVGVTVREAQKPHKTISRGTLMPYNAKKLALASKARTKASTSPFVIAIRFASIKHISGIINACILCFTFSASNSNLHIASHIVYGLVKQGHAPEFLAYTNECSAQIFVNLVTIFGLLTLVNILFIRIYFVLARCAQGIADDQMPYVTPFGIIGSIIALFFRRLISLTKDFSAYARSKDYGDFGHSNSITGYLGILLCLT
ncbi:hypothetical protein CC78DRAFT_600773 [Lojkania enalia]|uniref:Amino acid permease/ SLC12A domain-containing protein n=1 Tax=Lojkania enalia TaxID=147567 RepID=A0A9P4K9B9_9PLEO|nr:hypothetical protein CC78DRAFT_600773 [Didymosphaeria enalia]